MRGYPLGLLAFLLSPVLLLSRPAWATHDAGQTNAVLRFSEDGQSILVRQCDLQGTAGMLAVFGSDGKARATVDLAGETMPDTTLDEICGPTPDQFQRYLDLRDVPPEIKQLLRQFEVSVTPERGPLAPSRDRYVHIAMRGNRLQVVLLEGETHTVVFRAPALTGVLEAPGLEAEVVWHPRLPMAVAAGSRLTSAGDGVYEWQPFFHVLRFEHKAATPLSARLVASELHAQGIQDAKQGLHDDAREGFLRAAAWDPTYEKALYHAACALAADGETDQALKWLERLQALKTPESQQQLEKAAHDPELQSLRDLPGFKSLFAP